MTDGSDSKPPSIPAWQTTISHDTSDTSSNTSRDAGQAVPAQDRNAVLDQARIFLDDASVRDAPREKKFAFLEKKGLQNDEIQRLLDTSSSETASSSSRQDKGLKTVHDSSVSSSPASHSSAATTSPSSSSQTQSASQSKREIPPIITYPEFLLRPSKTPPLITLERLTYSLYTLAGISALTYGASKYLVQPMLQSLTSSRHDLASTALHNLEKLNEKLEGTVSRIPPVPHSTILKQRLHDKDNTDEDASDIETADSDPTELFHRDIATQTSPRLLHSPSLSNISTSSSTTSSSPHEKEKEAATITTQLTRLTTLKDSLTSLLQTESPQTSQSTPSLLLDTISDTQSYLDRLQFSLNSYNDYHLLYGSTLPPTANNSNSNKSKNAAGGGGGGKGKDEGEDSTDEAMRFRQEIRSVKGALLGVRSFPVGSRATTATMPTGAGGVVGVRSLQSTS